MDAQLALLLPVWLVALATPGPDTLAVSHAAVTGGRRAGSACAAGVATGIAAWAAALSGLALLLAQAGWLHRLLALAGAAYLVLAGARMLRAAWQGGDAPAAAGLAIRADAARVGSAVARAYRRGLLTNLANPKAAALFGSLFAVALPRHAGVAEGAALVLVFAGTTFAWYALLAGLLAGPRAAAAYRRAARGVNAAAGAAFLGFGARLAWAEAR
ncbi:LysE family transporter [Caldovatus aquaticus]|uniref:LysE family transporter n=1 Tax=Caldovatus aquaticus TaxID=2865671 RepID=A0ABS7F616_9PROT|nr:LysE family transporter [Caldovatus aquaticus]